MSADLKQALQSIHSQKEASLYDISFESGLLVSFLRFFGCTFCRETVEELVRLRRPLEQNGVKLAFVHMGEADKADDFFAGYGAADNHYFNDPKGELYRAMGIGHVSINQLLIPKVLWRFVTALPRYGYDPRKTDADQSLMPGIFLIHQGRIENSYQYKDISDRPDYLELADCELCTTESVVH